MSLLRVGGEGGGDKFNYNSNLGEVLGKVLRAVSWFYPAILRGVAAAVEHCLGFSRGG